LKKKKTKKVCVLIKVKSRLTRVAWAGRWLF